MFRKLKEFKPKEFLKNIFLENSDNPNKVASAMSLGVFIAIIPIYGFQSVIAVSLSHFLKLNKAIVFFATNISWPPMIFALIYANYQTGYFIFNGNFNNNVNLTSNTEILDNLGESFYLLFFGSIIFGLMFSSLTWISTRGILLIIKGKS